MSVSLFAKIKVGRIEVWSLFLTKKAHALVTFLIQCVFETCRIVDCILASNWLCLPVVDLKLDS